MGSALIMIFWTEHIEPFKAGTRNCVPCACELKDGRIGYFLGNDWKQEIEAKGVTVEIITKADLKELDV